MQATYESVSETDDETSGYRLSITARKFNVQSKISQVFVNKNNAQSSRL